MSILWQLIFMVLFATYVQQISAEDDEFAPEHSDEYEFALGYPHEYKFTPGYPDDSDDFEVGFRPLRLTRDAPFTCTASGRFPNPVNCSDYYLCVLISPGNLYLANMTCPNDLVFDPVNQYCTTVGNYSCGITTTTTTTTPAPTTACTTSGIICHTDTTYTLCAGPGVAILSNQTCEPGYFCNPKCVAPCINYVPLC